MCRCPCCGKDGGTLHAHGGYRIRHGIHGQSAPNVAEDHQTQNALALVRRDAALYVKDAEAKEQLVELAIETVKDNDKLQALNRNILEMALPDSAEIIAKEVLRLADEKEV